MLLLELGNWVKEHKLNTKTRVRLCWSRYVNLENSVPLAYFFGVVVYSWVDSICIFFIVSIFKQEQKKATISAPKHLVYVVPCAYTIR